MMMAHHSVDPAGPILIEMSCLSETNHFTDTGLCGGGGTVEAKLPTCTQKHEQEGQLRIAALVPAPQVCKGRPEAEGHGAMWACLPMESKSVLLLAMLWLEVMHLTLSSERKSS